MNKKQEKEIKKLSLHERLSVPETVWKHTISVLIGVGVGVVILLIIAFFSREARPTQYIFRLITDMFAGN